MDRSIIRKILSEPKGLLLFLSDCTSIAGWAVGGGLVGSTHARSLRSVDDYLMNSIELPSSSARRKKTSFPFQNVLTYHKHGSLLIVSTRKCPIIMPF